MEQRKHVNFITVLLFLLLAGALVFLVYTRFTGGQAAAPAPSTAAETAPSPSSDTETDAPELPALRADVQSYISSLNGRWSVSFQMLDSDESVSCVHGVKADTPMPSASLIRLWIMGAVYRQIADGKLSEADVSKLLSKMMRDNDSSAANALVRKLGGGSAAKGKKAVNSFAADCGCTGTTLSQLLPARTGRLNYTTSADCARLLRAIGSGTCVSKDASDEMLTLLLSQPQRSKIPAVLPQNVPCADLSASLSGISEADAAIVYLPGRAYILSVLVEPADNAAAAAQIKNVSQLVCDAVTGAA